MIWTSGPKLLMLLMSGTDDPNLAHNNSNKTLNPHNLHTCGNCTKSHAPGRASCPAKDSTCQSCGRIGHWDIRCQSTSSKQKDPNKKPPRHEPKSGKQKQTHTVYVGNDYDPQCNEVTIDDCPHHSAQLGQKPGDDIARPSALSPHVAQNTQQQWYPYQHNLPSPLMTQNTSISLQSTLVHSLKLRQLSPCLLK